MGVETRVYLVAPGNHGDPLAAQFEVAIKRGDYSKQEYWDFRAGQWAPLEEGYVAFPGVHTLVLPAEAYPALVKTVEGLKDFPLDGKTEARVLREWLALETARVDRSLRLESR